MISYLNERRYDAGDYEHRENHYVDNQPATDNPGALYDGFFEMSGVAQLLISPAHQKAGVAGVRGRQIAGSNSAPSPVGGFGKVPQVRSARAGSREDARGWSRPGDVFSTLGVQGQRIFGVDSLNRWPRDAMFAQQIPDDNPTGVHGETRRPKEHPTGKSEEQKRPAVARKSGKIAENYKGYERSSAHEADHDCQNLAEARAQGNGVHQTMLSDSAVQVGAIA
jgi:hypothetical protein